MKIPRRYIDYLTVFLLVYTSRETVLFGTNANTTVTLFGFFAPVLVLATLLIRHYKIFSPVRGRAQIRYRVHTRRLAIVIIALSLLTMALNLDFNLKYGYEIILCLIAFLLVNQIPFERFARVYNDIILFLSLFALVASILYIVLPGYVSAFPSITNTSGFRYAFLGFCVIPMETTGVLFRMYGIFREPGVAIIFINLALLFELFVLDRKKIFRVLILVLAVGFSLSTAGYIITFLIMLTYVLLSKKKHLLATIILLVVVSAGAILVMQNEFIFRAIFGKFSATDSASTGARFGSLTNNIKLIIDNPQGILFGMGYRFVENYFVNLGNVGNAVRGEEHNTNTLLKELSIHGALFFSIFMYRIYRFSHRLFNKTNLRSLMVFFIIVLALSNEDLTVNFILYLIVFYSFGDGLNGPNTKYESIRSSYLLQQKRENTYRAPNAF